MFFFVVFFLRLSIYGNWVRKQSHLPNLGCGLRRLGYNNLGCDVERRALIPLSTDFIRR